MGKNQKGKELGKGIGQRKDGLYYARVMDAFGNMKTRQYGRPISLWVPCLSPRKIMDSLTNTLWMVYDLQVMPKRQMRSIT